MMDDTASMQISCSSLTSAHTQDEKKTTAGQFMDYSAEIKHDDTGWYTYMLYRMT